MRFVAIVDGFVLSFFTKISHKFYRLTGYSNFFLAKLALCIMVASAMTTALGFWFPILGLKPSLALVAMVSFGSIMCLLEMNQCDREDDDMFSENRVRHFNPWHYDPIGRFMWVAITAALLPIGVHYLYMSSGKGIFIFKVLFLSTAPAIASFKYLVSVDPPSPSQSKIREWMKSFSAGRQKLVPVPVPIKE